MPITDSRASWPYPALTKAGPDDWLEISQEDADQLMGAVPAIFIPGGFMVSEPYSHTDTGVAILCTVVRWNGRLLAKHLPRTLGDQAYDLAMLEARS